MGLSVGLTVGDVVGLGVSLFCEPESCCHRLIIKVVWLEESFGGLVGSCEGCADGFAEGAGVGGGVVTPSN